MKQLIKQPFFLFLLFFIILLLPSTLFSRKFRRTPQDLPSYDYNESPPVRVTFIHHANHSNKPRLSVGWGIKPVKQTSTYFARSDALLDWSNTSVENFQKCFQGMKSAEILAHYELYPLPEFRAFIKTLFGYKKHIQKIQRKLLKRSGFIHFWAKACVISSPSHIQSFIEQMHNELVQEEEQINQLHHLYSAYKNCPTSYTKHSQVVSQRMHASQQSLNKNSQHSLGTSDWSDVNPIFIHTFNLGGNKFNLNSTPVQHVLQQEFHDIAQKTAQAWIRYKNNYVQQLVEKNVACIKSGIAYNQSGNVVEAARLADIGWAILDHIQAIGEGVFQGAGNVAQAFLHPVETVQGIAQCAYYLGQATLEAIDLCILTITNQSAACKKLQIWKRNFTKLTDTINGQLQITSNRDITKFVSCFTTEVFVAHKTFRALHKLFSIVRTNTAKLVQQTKKTAAIAKTSKGSTVVNEVAEHKQPVSKQTKRTAKKIAGEISNPKLIRTFNITEYDPSIGDLKKLEMAVKKLKDIEGTLKTNGPLRNTLRLGKKSCDPGHFNTARGAMYELEKALELIENKEFPSALGKRLVFESTSREFDIITSKRLIECKNIDWLQITGTRLETMKSKFGAQKKIAEGLGKIFEVHSKKPISDRWKQWFIKKGIHFVED